MLNNALKIAKQKLSNDDVNLIKVGDYQMQLKRQKRKSIALKAQHNQLFLHIPKQLTIRQIQTLVQTHQAWLLKQASRLQQVVEQRYQAMDNSHFSFLGQTCQLIYCDNIKQPQWSNDEQAAAPQLKIPMDFSLTPLQQQQRAANALKHWFIKQSQSYLSEQLDNYSQRMQLPYKSLQVKTYKGRWGSCYRDGRIQFNWRLLQAPQWVVNYVVVHELAHLQHANHSAVFWQLVERFYPQMPEAKQHLKTHGAKWIDFLQQYQ